MIKPQIHCLNYTTMKHINQNNMEAKTAVEWLIEQIKEDQNVKAKSGSEWKKTFDQALKIERIQSEQYAAFCVRCDRDELPLLEFESYTNIKKEEEEDV